jgi:hypothetical protein
MTNNIKIIAIIGIVIVAVFVAIGVLTYFNRNRAPEGELPQVSETHGTTNQKSQTLTPSATPVLIDYSQVELPASDNESLDNLITEEEIMEHEEEVAKQTEQPIYEEETEEVVPEEIVPEMTEEEIIEMKKKYEDAQKQAQANPDVQEPFGEPFVPDEPEPKPQRDADGYLYTKEEAIEIFRNEFQKLIDVNDFNYTYARETAIEDGNSTPEEFEADLNQLLTDPYSSEILTRAFEKYRQYGNLGILIGSASTWLSCGGDDGKYKYTETR